MEDELLTRRTRWTNVQCRRGAWVLFVSVITVTTDGSCDPFVDVLAPKLGGAQGLARNNESIVL